MSDMEVIDKKINEVANDNLDAIEKHLDKIHEDALRDEINNMTLDCSKDELILVAKLLIKISRKSFEDE
jgi:hypothetical protein|tara:strand:- start:345 stop:551 length:207 start_codon:yes stop_codon:yes gene_type:complete